MLWQISEGLDTLRAIGGALTDARHKPLQNIRIWHTVALEDPYPDPPGLEQYVPEDSPERAFSQVLVNVSCNESCCGTTILWPRKSMRSPR